MQHYSNSRISDATTDWVDKEYAQTFGAETSSKN
jgi:hypothetical protein